MGSENFKKQKIIIRYERTGSIGDAPHKQEYYAMEEWNIPQLVLPITEYLADAELSQPISPCMSKEQIAYVVECINSFK